MKYIKLFENFNNDIKSISLEEAISISQYSDIKSVSEWLHKPMDKIKYYYKEEPFEMFRKTAEEMESTYDELDDEYDRTKHILKLLRNGHKPIPIFVEKNDKDKFIMEGRHRIVAFMWNHMDKVPVIYVE